MLKNFWFNLVVKEKSNDQKTICSSGRNYSNADKLARFCGKKQDCTAGRAAIRVALTPTTRWWRPHAA